MSQYALLKHVGRDEYVIVKYTDTCLGVLGYFLTDGGSQDYFRSWIEDTQKGETVGKVTFLRKDGDDITIGLDPVITGKKDQFKTTKENLLSYIETWQKKIEKNPHEMIIKRNEDKIEFDILEHHERDDIL